MTQLNNPTILDRLFRRGSNPFVAKVHAHAINVPLLVHPSIGQQMIGAFLHGAVDTPPPIRAVSHDAEGNPISDTPDGIDPKRVAVLNISGALVHRPMPDMCGMGPISYTEIRRNLDAALSDEAVQAVILRMDTPGGMASGCFDLTDHIYASRGSKPIIALVDDSAYSAGYAIASACDEIWVSRTGGVGSAGVVFFHRDFSEANKKAGVTVTAIYSGDRKIDFNPNFPLSEEARAEGQASTDQIREMFVGAVAEYRGMTADAVRATQAACYTGQAAVAAGFADKVGTMPDLLQSLAQPAAAAAPTDPTNDTEDADDAGDPPTEDATVTKETDTPALPVDVPTALSPEDKKALARGQLAIALDGTSLPATVVTALMSIDLATAGRPPAEIVADASAIVDLCVAAGLPDLAADSVKSGATVEQTRASLAAARAAGERELVTTLPALGAAKPDAQLNVLDGVSIYQMRGNRNGS